MVRTKTPAKSSRTYSSLGSEASSNASARSAYNRSSSKEANRSNVSHSKSSSRKSRPKKTTTKSETKMFVQKKTSFINKSGKKTAVKFKIIKHIKFLQSSVHNLIPKFAFSRLVREILYSYGETSQVSRCTATALDAIQEAAEIYLTCLFADCNLLAFHAKRVTIKPTDMALVLTLRQNQ